MNEREYCFKVKDLEKSRKFCIDNGFNLDSETEQIRTIYRKSDKTMARITEDRWGDNIKLTLDFKEDKLNNESLSIRKESKALEFVDTDSVLSVLEFLGYEKDNVLNRKRWVYSKGKVICEIDLYDNEEQTIVVSIEGEDYAGVDAFYQKFVGSVGGNEK